jgi:HEAT repeat protein
MKKLLLIAILFLTPIFVLQTFAQTAKEKAFKEMTKVLAELSAYNYGEPEHWKPKLIEAMKPVYYNEDAKAEVEKLMLLFLKSDAAPEAKQAIQREFSQIASKDSENDILEMLKDEKSATLALYILDNAELGNINQFKKIAPDATDLVKIGIINLLGNREDEKAVVLLSDLAQTKNKQIALAAISSLSKIGTAESAGALMSVSKSLPADLNSEVAEAKLKCAYKLLDKGHSNEAKNIFQELNNSSNSISVQTSALNGLFRLSDEKPAFITEQLKGTSNPELKSQIIRLVIELPENFQNGKEFFEVDNLSVQHKVQLLTILGKRKDSSIHNTILGFLKQDDAALKQAALEAIPKAGSAKDVIILAEMAAQTSGGGQALARNALNTLPGESVDAQIIKLISDSQTETNIKLELIKATGDRKMAGASDILFNLAKSENTTLKNEAIKALGNIGNYADLDKIMELLVNSTSARERNELEGAAYLMAEKNPDISASSGILNSYLKESEDEKNITSIISILGKLGNPEDYKEISSYYENSNAELQSAAIRAVAEWPTAQPLDDLTKIMKNTSDERQHALAVRSFLQIIEANEEMGASEKMDRLNGVNNLSNNLVEKRMVISAYSRMRTAESLQQLVQLMNSTEIRREVEIAIQEMAPRIRERNDGINKELQKAIQLSDNESFKTQMKEVIERRSQN